MVSINYATREVCCKIVYYGPGLSGKTTNLQVVHQKVPENTRGKLISLATEADRTLYFDFLPINIGSINGFAAKFQLYTVPGQVYYNATRKLVLRGVDGVVFVADSQADKLDDNLESLSNLKENLQEYGYNLNELPIVIQYNKTDLQSAMTRDALEQKLNTMGWPSFTASAVSGVGVFDTLKAIMKLVLEKARTGGVRQGASSTQSTKPAQASAQSGGSSMNQSGSSAVATAEAPSHMPPSASSGASTSSAPMSQGAAPKAGAIFGSSTNTVPGRKRVGQDTPVSGPQRQSAPAPKPSGASNQGAPNIFGSKKSESNQASASQSHSGARDPQQATAQSASSGSSATKVNKPAPFADMPGHDPLEEPPSQPKKKRGFFRRLFGLK